MPYRILLLVLVMLFLASGLVRAEEPRSVQEQLRTYYFEAARAGDSEMLEAFIQAGYDLNSADAKGYTALILAAYHGHLPLVQRLLDAGADPCAQDSRGNTALMGAIFKGELRVAHLLLETPCNPDQRNGAGQTAAMYAALFQREELLQALRQRGADLQTTDALGNSAQSLARGELQTQRR